MDNEHEFLTFLFQTIDNTIFPISTEYTSESLLIKILEECSENKEPIPIQTSKEDFELMYSYMKYSTLNKPNIDLIEKPAMKPVHEYLQDNWYINFFPETIKKCQYFYNLADYFGLPDLSKIILGHISYLLNCKYRHENIEKHLTIGNYKQLQQVFNVKKEEFEGMTKKENEEYVNNQRKLWNTFLNPDPEINLDSK